MFLPVILAGVMLVFATGGRRPLGYCGISSTVSLHLLQALSRRPPPRSAAERGGMMDRSTYPVD